MLRSCAFSHSVRATRHAFRFHPNFSDVRHLRLDSDFRFFFPFRYSGAPLRRVLSLHLRFSLLDLPSRRLRQVDTYGTPQPYHWRTHPHALTRQFVRRSSRRTDSPTCTSIDRTLSALSRGEVFSDPSPAGNNHLQICERRFCNATRALLALSGFGDVENNLPLRTLRLAACIGRLTFPGQVLLYSSRSCVRVPAPTSVRTCVAASVPRYASGVPV